MTDITPDMTGHDLDNLRVLWDNLAPSENVTNITRFRLDKRERVR